MQHREARLSAPTVVLARHGRTKLNSDEAERIRGWLDLPLTEEGERDAVRAAEQLRQYPAAHLVSSDLRRARDTAAIIGEALGLEPEVDPDLRPWHVGHLAGKLVSEIREEMDHYQKHPEKRVPGGESFQSFRDRWEGRLLALLKRAEKTPGKAVVVLTHVRNLLTVPHILASDDGPVDLIERPQPRTGAVVRLSKSNGKWKMDKHAFRNGGD